METKSPFSEKVKETLKSMEDALEDIEQKIEEGAEDVKGFYQKEKEKLQERIKQKKSSWKESVDQMKMQLKEIEKYILKLQEKIVILLKGDSDGFELAQKEALEIRVGFYLNLVILRQGGWIVLHLGFLYDNPRRIPVQYRERFPP